MRTLIFDISGEYALFKKPYSPMSPVSYPLPPPPTVLGILGAVLGYDKTNYHQRLNYENVRIGVALRQPTRVYRAALNLLQTKTGTDSFFRPLAAENTHTQVPCEFLRQPEFRLYISGLETEIADDLAARLQTGRSAYTVTLGWANCFAELTWVGEATAQPLVANEWQAATAVPLAAGVQIHYDDRRRYHRQRIPVVMNGERIVSRYQEIVLAEDGQSIRGHGGAGVLYAIDSTTIAFL
ncbi:type I-B CRISPR-associated protein Cas5 [Chromatium okenii]|uniref:type I-B CRISPR-associated protein Cas5b n=1 Tax=Chromatium okenii TaxID=61644 RepID=UPI001907DCE3|nr:type I-B CRISPR-associated protein Cas5b [Chromatium okenii]MBK1642715.1 type I-B CRISPR-associated protein Cas5 [Chromatium okenii]